LKNRRMFLWRIESDGSGRREISPGSPFVFDLRAGSNGTLAFNEVGANDGIHVWSSDADGGGRRQLTDGGGGFLLELSPDGRTALFARSDQFNVLFSVSTDGGEAKALIEPVSRGIMYSPAGDLLVYSRLEEIQGRVYPRRVVVPAAGGDPVATFLLPPRISDLGWSPEGRALTYIDAANGYNIMRQSIDGGDPEPITRFTEGRVLLHRWSPDGRSLSITRRIDGKESLWSRPAEGGEPVLVADFRTGRIFGHRWARDSRGLLFAYGQETQEVVMIRDFR